MLPLNLDEKALIAEYQKSKSPTKTAAKFKCHYSVVLRILKKHRIPELHKPSPRTCGSKVGTIKAADKSGGIDSLRSLFGKEEIMRRRTTKLQDKVSKFVNTTLKQKQWMPDADVRAVLGLNSADFAMVRHDYEGLLLEPTDENRRKILIWVHPDYYEAAQDAINGTSK